ncbi:MAG: hypothetical protein WC374_06945 [Phycisphaerae bacterium]
MRANNAAIFADLIALNTRNPELVALTGGSFKTAALANANTYNGRSFFTCTAGVSDTPSAAAWLIIGYWNPTDSSGRFVAMSGASLETWEIKYSNATWGTWTQLTNASGNVTRNVTGDVTGNVTGDVTGNADTATLAAGASSIKETGAGAGTVRKKIIEIGDWDMDAANQKAVNHGLTPSKIRDVRVIIRNDTNTSYYPIDCFDDATDPSMHGGGVNEIRTLDIVFERRTGGMFDGPNFDSTSYNRGWITIEYVD